MPGFIYILGIQTSVVTLAWPLFLPLEHVPSPSFLFQLKAELGRWLSGFIKAVVLQAW